MFDIIGTLLMVGILVFPLFILRGGMGRRGSSLVTMFVALTIGGIMMSMGAGVFQAITNSSTVPFGNAVAGTSGLVADNVGDNGKIYPKNYPTTSGIAHPPTPGVADESVMEKNLHAGI